MNRFKIAITSIALVFSLTTVFAPQPAHAFVVTDLGAIATAVGKWAWEKGTAILENSLLSSAKVALVNAAKNYMQQMAYQSAVYLGSGGQGQKPQVFSSDWKTYLEDAAMDAAGSFTEDIAGEFGVTRCHLAGGPGLQAAVLRGTFDSFSDDSAKSQALKRQVINDPTALARNPLLLTELGIEIGDKTEDELKAEISAMDQEKLTEKLSNIDPNLYRSQYIESTHSEYRPSPKTSRCPGDTFQKFDAVDAEYTDSRGNFDDNAFWGDVRSTFHKNDLTETMNILSEVHQGVNKAKIAVEAERSVNKGFKDSKTKVAKYVTTPGTLVAEQAFGLTPDKLQASEREVAQMSAGETFEYLLASTAATFLNTASQAMLNRLAKEGLIALDQILGGGRGGNDAIFSKTASQRSSGGREIAELSYATLRTAQIATGNEFSLITEYAACPRDAVGPNHCVVDQGMVTATNLTQQGQPVTVKEAIEKGYLKGDWKLYPPNHDLNTSLECYRSGYCHSNLVKLRRARVLPVGFEIAASLSPSQNPWQLKTVVDNFNNCNTANERDADHPFCHLIDPHWILKAPPMRCNALAYGPLLSAPGTNTRQKVCVDLQDCPITDENGKCVGAWGYCLAEKNSWNIGGDSCPAHSASCEVFTSRSGSKEGYLTTTVDHSVCDENNVGCRRFFNTKVYKASSGSLSVDVDQPMDQRVWFDSEYPILIDSPGPAFVAAGIDIIMGDAYDIPEDVTHSPSTYFNKNITQCNGTENGCTKLVRADNTEISMKIAPDYLKCYDLKPEEFGLQLPFTVEDAQEIASRPGCEDFAPVCAAEEVGCKAYIETASFEQINGVVRAQDACSAQCVGYEGFAKEKTNFEPAEFPKFFIPKTAQQCPFTQIGCDEFVNLDAQSAGGEQKEYFSFVRHCEKPDGNVPNFYTWEGSEEEGLKIVVHHLVEDTQGNPKYNTEDVSAQNDFSIRCNASTYGQDPDCREVYNDLGVVSYRLFSKTISISEDCHPYRRSNATEAECEYAGGDWNNGQCLFNAIPSESSQCQAQFAGCRQYTGQGGAGTITQISEQFEGDIPASIQTENIAVEISKESIINEGQSLKIPKDLPMIYSFDADNNTTYNVEFWAKGTGLMNIAIDYKDGESAKSAIFAGPGSASDGNPNAESDRRLTTQWKKYRFGPVLVAGNTDPSDAKLKIVAVSGSSDIFIDNLKLIKGNTHALIKNSWNTPNACDADQSDNLPGVALGCSEYTETATNKKVYLKSFTSLCREESVGCENLIDTRNSASDSGASYNTNEEGTLGVQNDNLNDDIYLQPDRLIRAVVSANYTCSPLAVGCTEYGFKYLKGTGKNTEEVIESVYLINNPDAYDRTLCQAEAIGCEAFQSKQGTRYFKDPNITGKKCVYIENSDPNATERGWYKVKFDDDGKKDFTEQCYPDFISQGKQYGIWKNLDPAYEGYTGVCEPKHDQCTEFVDRTDIDPRTNKAQAYYVINNDKIDTSSCQGEVSRQEGCVLFDNTANPNKPYSATSAYQASEKAFGAKVTASDHPNEYANITIGTEDGFYKDNIQCSREVIDILLEHDDPIFIDGTKQRQICDNFSDETRTIVCEDKSDEDSETAYLFKNNFEDINGFLDSQKGYVPLCQQKLGASNTILKVTRDRQCSAWLAPNSFTTEQNAPAGRQKQVTGLGLCDQASSERGGITTCASWLDPSEHEMYATVLTADNYAKRDVSFTGEEYAGMSQAERFLPYHFEPAIINEKPTIIATINDSILFDSIDKAPEPTQVSAIGCSGQPDNTICGAQAKGICINDRCIYDIDGNQLSSDVNAQLACRGYPEETSPFSEKLASWYSVEKRVDPRKVLDQNYNSANLCQDGNECTCSYKKTYYQNGTKKLYYSLDKAPVVGYCIGGVDHAGRSKSGLICERNKQCRDDMVDRTIKPDHEDFAVPQDGICQRKESQEEVYRGWEGFCLEEDRRFNIKDDNLRNLCQSWYPIDKGTGLNDINNQFETAGYVPPLDRGTYWCAMTTSFGSANPNAEFDFPGSPNELEPAHTNRNTVGYFMNRAKNVTHYILTTGRGTIASLLSETDVSTNDDYHNQIRHKLTGNGADRLLNANLKDIDGFMLVIPEHIFNDEGDSGQPNPKDSDNSSTFVTDSREIFIENSDTHRCHDNTAKNNPADPDFDEYCSKRLDGLQIETGISFEPVHTAKDVASKHRGYVYETYKYTYPDGMVDLTFAAYTMEAVSDYVNREGFTPDIDSPKIDRSGYDALFDANGSRSAHIYHKEKGFVELLHKHREEYNLCDEWGKNGDHDKNYVAYALRYNAEGEFMGIFSSLCKDNISDGNNTRLTLDFELDILTNNRCINFVKAVEENEDGQNNYAYTQRMWHKQFDQEAGSVFYDRDEGVPNGSYSIPFLDIPAYTPHAPIYGSAQTSLVQTNAPIYTFTQSLEFQDLGFATGIKEKNGVKDSDFNDFDDIYISDSGSNNSMRRGSDDSYAIALSCSFGRCGKYTFNKKPYDFTQFLTATKDGINKLFSKVFSITGDLLGQNVELDDRADNGRPPHIASLDFSKKLISGAYPIKNINAFSINQTDGSDTKMLFGIDNLTATAQFVAWADTDQMPLRDIRVDWGDGGPHAGGSKGKYKNKKPYCTTDPEKHGWCITTNEEIYQPNITCRSDEECSSIADGAGCAFGIEVFGNDPVACEEGFFEYQHIYTWSPTCGAGSVDDVSANLTDSKYPKRIVVSPDMLSNPNIGGVDFTELRTLGVRAGDVLCMYKPRVQVKDNWGWCNGTCNVDEFNAGAIEANQIGCFEGASAGDGFGDGNDANQCDSNLKDGLGWTEFKGTIILVSDD